MKNNKEHKECDLDIFWVELFILLTLSKSDSKSALILNGTGLGWDLTFFKIVIIIHYKKINLDSITNENNKEHNGKWPYIPDHPYRSLIIGGFGSGKTNALLNLVKEQNDIDKIHLYAKDLSEPKDEFLIKNCKNVGI